MDRTVENWDVVVIGGGAAGLAAAQEVARAGCRTLLIEARSRIGGRIYTVEDPSFSVPVELGAEFIHDTPKNLLDIAQQGRLVYHDLSDEHSFGLCRMECLELVPLPHFWEDLALVMKKARALGGRDRSFAEFILLAERDRETRRFLPFVQSYVAGFHAADPRLISLKALAEAELQLSATGGRRVFRFSNGYGGVAKWLAEGARRNGAEIRLNTVAYELKWSFDSVELEMRSRAGMRLPRVRARKAIITIPLSLLQSSVHELVIEGAIRFDPPIRAKERAADLLRMGPVMKLLLRFRSRFWESASTSAVLIHQDLAQLAFIHHADDPDVTFPTWWTQRPLRLPMLTAWAGGPQAFEMGDHTEEALVDEAIRSFSLISGFSRATIERELESWSFHDWQSDPYTRGAYSYVGVNGENAQRELAEPMLDTLFFAGEAVNYNGQSGTVDGAIETGTLAGREVIQTLLSSARASRSG